jgi:hypothetical protein
MEALIAEACCAPPGRARCAPGEPLLGFAKLGDVADGERKAHDRAFGGAHGRRLIAALRVLSRLSRSS